MEQKSIRVKAAVWTLLFVIVFVISALFCIRMLGTAPMKLLEVDWDDTISIRMNGKY